MCECGEARELSTGPAAAGGSRDVLAAVTGGIDAPAKLHALANSPHCLLTLVVLFFRDKFTNITVSLKFQIGCGFKSVVKCSVRIRAHTVMSLSTI